MSVLTVGLASEGGVAAVIRRAACLPVFESTVRRSLRQYVRPILANLLSEVVRSIDQCTALSEAILTFPANCQMRLKVRPRRLRHSVFEVVCNQAVNFAANHVLSCVRAAVLWCCRGIAAAPLSVAHALGVAEHAGSQS